MDPCLRLALLESDYLNDAACEIRERSVEELKARYAEVLALEVSADADGACWTDESDLWGALPDGADGTIRSLAGIEGFPGVSNLYLRESEVGDLGPLAALPALELLWVGVPPDADLTPLLACDQLKRVRIGCAAGLLPAGHEVLAALAARGVQVDNFLPDPVEAAAPFGDPILKLAVLDRLQGSVELPPMYFFDEFEFDEGNLARLMAVVIPQAALDTVDILGWFAGGGYDTAHMVWHQWDGESDEFYIRSLAGVEALRNLRELDLTPLAVLPEHQIAQLRARGIKVSEYEEAAKRRAALAAVKSYGVAVIDKAVAGANALTRRWVDTLGSDASTVVSGVGVWPLLAYLAPAADGPGRDELTAAMGVPADDAATTAAALVALLQSTDGVRAAIGVWARPGLDLKAQWRDSLPTGTVKVLNNQRVLDTWVRRQTDGLLDRMPVEIDPSIKLMLASALVARTGWVHPFNDGTLIAEDGPWAGQRLWGLHRSTADRDLLAVYDTPAGQVTVVTVEGADGFDVDLAIGLPDAPATAVLAAGLDSRSAVPARRGSQLALGDTAPGVSVDLGWAYDDSPGLVVSLPRFTVRSSHNLLEHAGLFGLRTVSDLSGEHLPGLSDALLGVEAAAQHLTASFTAEGFEAVAVTATGIGYIGAPLKRPLQVQLLLDRPFGFVARHRDSGLALVAGWVAQAGTASLIP
ncbi:DUF6892 domain-containing protein [Catellatospora sichuanensis]|uniref:DUF6892 domain-containing protein n=1 Tax=Catellatospora sichuanensis TaxID=1969805 RepID=UPI001183A026|nr:serpin family protein [Catellatospora sichuanensis]